MEELNAVMMSKRRRKELEEQAMEQAKRDMERDAQEMRKPQMP